MKRFLRRLFIAVLPLAIFYVALEIHCRTKTVIAIKKAYLEQYADSVKVLILGDSHSNMNINPELIGKPAATLALGGQPLSIDYFLLRRYIDRLPRLETVVLEVSPNRFYYDLELTNWNAYLYRAIYGIDYKTAQFSFSNYSLVIAHHKHCTSLLLNYYGLRGKRHHINEYGFTVDDSDGRFRNMRYDEKRIAETFKIRHKFLRSSAVDSNRTFLEGIAELCRSRGLELVLVSAPLYKTYRNALPEAALQQVNHVLDDVEKKYHLRRLSYVSDTVFTIYDFKDDDHLNPAGAAKFTRMLNRDLFEKRGFK